MGGSAHKPTRPSQFAHCVLHFFVKMQSLWQKSNIGVSPVTRRTSPMAYLHPVLLCLLHPAPGVYALAFCAVTRASLLICCPPLDEGLTQ